MYFINSFDEIKNYVCCKLNNLIAWIVQLKEHIVIWVREALGNIIENINLYQRKKVRYKRVATFTYFHLL